MLHRLADALVVETNALENRLDPWLALPVADTVELRAEDQVLERRQLLEEARLDAHPIDVALYLARVRHCVYVEDPDGPGIRQRQRRDDTDQRALAGPVRPEDADNLAAAHVERDALQRIRVLAALFPELLFNVVELERVRRSLDMCDSHAHFPLAWPGPG